MYNRNICLLNTGMGKIDYLCHSNSTNLVSKDIDITQYDAICLMLGKNNMAFESGLYPLSQLQKYSFTHLSLIGEYSGEEYNGYVLLHKIEKITAILVSSNDLLLSVYGIRF